MVQPLLVMSTEPRETEPTIPLLSCSLPKRPTLTELCRPRLTDNTTRVNVPCKGFDRFTVTLMLPMS
jgi:hypothetical protein